MKQIPFILLLVVTIGCGEAAPNPDSIDPIAAGLKNEQYDKDIEFLKSWGFKPAGKLKVLKVKKLNKFPSGNYHYADVRHAGPKKDSRVAVKIFEDTRHITISKEGKINGLDVPHKIDNDKIVPVRKQNSHTVGVEIVEINGEKYIRWSQIFGEYFFKAPAEPFKK